SPSVSRVQRPKLLYSRTRQSDLKDYGKPPTSYSPEIATASSKIDTVSPENLLEKVAADLPKIADSPEKIAATAANATPPEIVNIYFVGTAAVVAGIPPPPPSPCDSVLSSLSTTASVAWKLHANL
ncbi:hypothetical protein Tco_1472049, partial [Tanacetum coccineum]